MDNGRFPIKIYDTKGLEAMNAYNQLDEIIKGVKKRNNSDDIFNWFHTIFYCVSMSNPRFEDFEVNFIRRLQQELTQHIHIILTNCDACNEDKIHQMKEKILNSLKDKRNIRIFEVVSVSMKKRNGKIVSPRGKEVILEQVFDLLLKDVAGKVSCTYAKTLRSNLENIAYKTYKKIDEMIEKTVKFKTLWNMIADGDNAERHLEDYINNTLEQLEKELETTQRHTDQKFNQILQPIAQLFNSYRGFVTNSFVDNSKLNFEDMIEWSSTNWIKSIDLLNDDDFLMKKLLPKLYKIGGCDFDIDEDNIIEVLKAIFHGIGDLFSLKQNLKNLCQDFYNDFIHSIPREAELQQEVYKRIINFMKPLNTTNQSKNVNNTDGGLEERIRLPRLKYPHYTTGNAQDWTYEYTWEDFEAFRPDKNPLHFKNSPGFIIEVYHKLFPYLIKHPEKLLEGGYFHNFSVNEIRVTLEMMYHYPNMPPNTTS